MEEAPMEDPLADTLTEPELVAMLKRRKIKAGQRTLRSWRQRKKGPPYVELPNRAKIYSRSGLASWLESG